MSQNNSELKKERAEAEVQRAEAKRFAEFMIERQEEFQVQYEALHTTLEEARAAAESSNRVRKELLAANINLENARTATLAKLEAVKKEHAADVQLMHSNAMSYAELEKQLKDLQAAHLKICNEHEVLEDKYQNVVEKGKHFQGQREEILMEREKRMLEAEERATERERMLIERERSVEERRAEENTVLRTREARNTEMESGLAAIVRGESEGRRCTEELEGKRAEAARLVSEAARLGKDVADPREQGVANETKQKAFEAMTQGEKSAKRKLRELRADMESWVQQRAKAECSKAWKEGNEAGMQKAKKAFAKEVDDGSYWEECPVCMNQPANLCLFPCGHTLCSDPACPSKGCKQCPMCRETVKRRCTIFRGSGVSDHPKL